MGVLVGASIQRPLIDQDVGVRWSITLEDTLGVTAEITRQAQTDNAQLLQRLETIAARGERNLRGNQPVAGKIDPATGLQDQQRRFADEYLVDFNGTAAYMRAGYKAKADEPLTVIACEGVWLVSMSQRVDDNTWIASLDRHRHGPGGPFRRCSSYEQGRAGAEMWVARYEARLRQDVAEISRWREAVGANRLAKETVKRPFAWME